MNSTLNKAFTILADISTVIVLVALIAGLLIVAN